MKKAVCLLCMLVLLIVLMPDHAAAANERDSAVKWEQGTITAASGLEKDYPIVIRTADYLRISDYVGLTLNADHYITYFVYDADYNYLGNGSADLKANFLLSGQGISTYEMLIRYPDGEYFRIALWRGKDGVMTPDMLDGAGVEFLPADHDPVFWEMGSIYAASGIAFVREQVIRSVNYLPVEDYAGVTVVNGYAISFLAYDKDLNYLGNGNPAKTGYFIPGVVAMQDILEQYPDTKYVRLLFREDPIADFTMEAVEKSQIRVYKAGETLPEPDLKQSVYMNIKKGQDGAIYDGKVFEFDKYGNCTVYSLSDKTKIATFTLDRVDVLNPHANSVCFGSTYYAEGDKYPLLYVNIYNNYANAADKKEGICCVYRLTETDGVFFTKLVQVIKIGFVDDTTLWKSPEGNDDRSYGNFVVDTDNNQLYVFVRRWGPKEMRFFRFALPGLDEGAENATYGCKEVTLRVEDIEQQFTTEEFDVIQGCCYSSGKIIALSGLPYSPYNAAPAIRFVDPKAGEVETYWLNNYGVTDEPELVSVDPVTGTMYYAAIDGKLRVFKFANMHFHGFDRTVTSPTCTEQGYTTYTCACGESYVDDYVEATGKHIWTSWQQIAEVNCQGQGRWMRACQTCPAEQYTTDQDGSSVSFNSPAILVNAGDTVVLSYYDVAFNTDMPIDATDITWNSNQLTIDQGCVTPAEPGVYPLTATSGAASKTVYLVVKAPGDAEYVLYFDDFTDATLSGYRPIEVSSGARYYVSDGKLILDASNSSQSYIRILLPEWIGDFGDYEIRTTFTMTEALDSTKWFAVMARVQDEDVPYLQAPVRFNATAANGIELDQKNKDNNWVILHKTSYTEKISPSKYYIQTFSLSGRAGCHAINGKTLLESDSMAYGPGDVGFQVRGSAASIDSIKIVIPVDTSAHTFGDWTLTAAPSCTAHGTETRSCAVCGYTESRKVDPCHDLAQHTEKMHTCTESGWLAYESCTRCDYSTLVEVAPTGHSYQRWIHSVAHRGYSQIAPENTLAAYKLAKQLGYFYVECDVAFTADGIPVLLHDDTIDRTSDGTGKISELAYEQLLQYDFGSWKSASYAGTSIPTFEEFIALCVELDLHPYIELKSSGNYTQEKVRQLVDIVEAHGMTGKVTWISFSNTFLGYVKNADPTARLGYIYSGDATESVINTAKKLRTDRNEVFLALNYSKITNTGILRAAANGFAVEVWTVNSKSAILALPAYVSGVISDKLNAHSILVDRGIVITAPACTEKGYTTYTCACGESYVDDYVDALGHSYEDGVCTGCGKYYVNFQSATISLAGNIAINFYVELGQPILDDESAFMSFTLPDGTTKTAMLSDAEVSVKNGVTRYVFTCEVHAKQMADMVVAQMHLGDGTAVGDSRSYSVVTYAGYIIAHEDQYSAYPSLVNLLKTMLNYGAYSQIHFGYNVNNLANANLNLTLNDVTLNEVEAYRPKRAGSMTGLEITSVALILRSETVLRFYYTLASGCNIEDYNFVVNGQAVRPIYNQDNGRYYVDVTNIAAKDLDREYGVTVTNKAGTESLSVIASAMSYVYQVIASPSYFTEDVKDVVKAMYAYNIAANAYFK